MSKSMTMEQLGKKIIKDLEQMSPEEKKVVREHLEKAFLKPRKNLDREFHQKNIFVAPNGVVKTLREMKQPVTRETYAEMAYWKTYRSLSVEEKEDVKQAVYEANIQ